MSGQDSITPGGPLQPVYLGEEITHALAEADAPRHGDQTPGQWVRSNLFNTWYNSIITVVFGALAAVLVYYTFRFVFVTARWEPVRENLELFMIGTFPREERTRVVVQLILMSGSIGLIIGYLRNRAARQAEQSGVEVQETPKRDLVATYSAIGIFLIAALVVGARTVDPWLVTLACLGAAATGYLVTRPLANPFTKLVLAVPLVIAAGILTRVQDLNNTAAYTVALIAVVILAIVHFVRVPELRLSAGLLAGVVGFQAMSGTDGIAWLFLALALLPIALYAVNHLQERQASQLGWIGVAAIAAALVWRLAADGIALVPIVLAVVLVAAGLSMVGGDSGPALQFGGAVVVAAVAFVLAGVVDLDGIDWKDWSGLHLNIIVASAAIVLAFPIGLLLALGRRSSLPVLRWLSTVYIELIRGVPLISLLLMGQFFIGFFLNTDDPLSNVTRATAAITMFSAAYIAEIVRGGLQAVAPGQTEAGQALGLPPAKITRLLVLPQALRAVIPAMVGQFISLFKDTSLLVIIGITEFLGVREIVHAQEAFRGFGIAETLIFVAFGFWAISFTMSRESQRLERRLGVGVR